MLRPIAALRAWFDGSWDDACLRCGMCCYEREVGEDGSVGIDFSAPCEFLNEDSRLCRVYDERFLLIEPAPRRLGAGSLCSAGFKGGYSASIHFTV